MRALTQACRAICYYTAACLDRGNHGDDAGDATSLAGARRPADADRQGVGARRSGRTSRPLGIQVHGGMGYVEETGVAQYYRDARIASIYEGTNGIQAIDLRRPQAAARRRRHRLGVRVGDASRRRAARECGRGPGERPPVARERARRTRAVLVAPAGRRAQGSGARELRGLQLPDVDGHRHRRLAAGTRRAGRDRRSSRPTARTRSSCARRC